MRFDERNHYTEIEQNPVNRGKSNARAGWKSAELESEEKRAGGGVLSDRGLGRIVGPERRLLRSADPQLIQQHFCRLNVGDFESLGNAGVCTGEQLPRLNLATLLLQQSGNACGSA
jgi:hypothetical protein